MNVEEKEKKHKRLKNGQRKIQYRQGVYFVTIPSDLIPSAQLKPGDHVQFFLERGDLVIRKVVG